jgi:hypothetical protein
MKSWLIKHLDEKLAYQTFGTSHFIQNIQMKN